MEQVPIKPVTLAVANTQGLLCRTTCFLLPAEAGTHLRFTNPGGWTVELAGERGKDTVISQVLFRSESSVSADSFQ